MPSKASWTIGLVMAFVVLTLISGICEVTYMGSDETNRIQMLLQPTIPAHSSFISGLVAYVTAGWDYIINLWGMFWFDYAFFTGGYAIFRYIFFLPISIGLILSIILSALPGSKGSP